MKKRTLSEPGFPEFKDRSERLSVEITEKTDPKLTNELSRRQFIYSLIGLISGIILIVGSIFVLFTKDNMINNPVIDTPIIKISAGQLTVSIIFAIIGLLIIFITRHSFKIKKSL